MSDELREASRTCRNTPTFSRMRTTPYLVQDINDAEEKQAEAEQLLAKSGRLGDRASQYQISTVLLAVALFFGGIATLFKRSGKHLHHAHDRSRGTRRRRHLRDHRLSLDPPMS